MKEEINLLPPPVQRTRYRQLYTVRVRRIYNALLLAALLVAGGYAAAYAVIYWNSFGLGQSLAVGERTASDADKQTRETNVKLNVVRKTLKDHAPYAQYAAEALRTAPAGIVVTSVEAHAESQSIIISGTSSTRAEVVQFEDKLHELTWAKKIDSPLQNLASGPGVTFRFTITRNL